MRMRRPGHVARVAVKKYLYKVSPPDTEANGSLGKQRLKRKNNIKTNLRQYGESVWTPFVALRAVTNNVVL